jgi:dienelactone hydrolase
MRLLLTLSVLLIGSVWAKADIKTKDVEYQFDGITFKGQLTWDDAIAGKRPGVLVVHEWWGLDDYAKSRAKQLAGLGYVAFACDMYGNGQVAQHPTDAGKMASTVRKNADIWRGRAKAALKVLSDFEKTDPSRLASMGYCFGGTTSLQLAYTGADLKAVVTFHSAITPLPTEEQLKNVKAKILVCHGAEDNFIKKEDLEKFQDLVKGAKIPFQLESYPGAVHSFTVEGADKHMIKGMAYNADADKKSWESMKKLFAEVFAK